MTLTFIENKKELIEQINGLENVFLEGEPTLFTTEEDDWEDVNLITLELEGNVVISQNYLKKMIEDKNDTLLTLYGGHEVSAQEALTYLEAVIDQL